MWFFFVIINCYWNCNAVRYCIMSSVRHDAHIDKDYGDPAICRIARLEQVLKGIKSVQSRAPSRLPITLDLLRKMRQSWQKRGGANHDNVMLWAAATLCFFGFFRSGEITLTNQGIFI